MLMGRSTWWLGLVGMMAVSAVEFGCSDEVVASGDGGSEASVDDDASTSGSGAGGSASSSGAGAGAACTSCSGAIMGGETPCTEGSPSSQELLDALYDCVCGETSACRDSCHQTVCCGDDDCAGPDDACLGCVSDVCGAEAQACMEDA